VSDNLADSNELGAMDDLPEPDLERDRDLRGAIWVDGKWKGRLMELRARGVVKSARVAAEQALEAMWGEFFPAETGGAGK